MHSMLLEKDSTGFQDYQLTDRWTTDQCQIRETVMHMDEKQLVFRGGPSVTAYYLGS